MQEKLDRAICLISTGNPITLITQLQFIKEIGNLKNSNNSQKYTVYVFLNPCIMSSDNIHQYENEIKNTKQIINYYSKWISLKLIINEDRLNSLTHGGCVDFLYELVSEPLMMVMEEDVITDIFNIIKWYDLLDDSCDLLYINEKTDNNITSSLISPVLSLDNYKELHDLNVYTIPILYLKKSAFDKEHVLYSNWITFDYVIFKPNQIFNTKQFKIIKTNEYGFDTMQFFKFITSLDKSLKIKYYNYYRPQCKSHGEIFDEYTHFGNSSLYYYLKKFIGDIGVNNYFINFPQQPLILDSYLTYYIFSLKLNLIKDLIITILGEFVYDELNINIQYLIDMCLRKLDTTWIPNNTLLNKLKVSIDTLYKNFNIL